GGGRSGPGAGPREKPVGRPTAPPAAPVSRAPRGKPSGRRSRRRSGRRRTGRDPPRVDGTARRAAKAPRTAPYRATSETLPVFPHGHRHSLHAAAQPVAGQRAEVGTDLRPVPGT